MNIEITLEKQLTKLVGTKVVRPNKSGTLSGHAAGEPFEKEVYSLLKNWNPNKVFKQYEYLNDLYLKNPKFISVEDRYKLLDSPTVLFLLSRGEKATREWSPTNIFEEKQNDTADILFQDNDKYVVIDVKTRNLDKSSQPPNIISAYKLAKMCANMIDNSEYDTLDICYVDVAWKEISGYLVCEEYKIVRLFKTPPSHLYINWAAAMQIQFHVKDLQQDWDGNIEDWCREYISNFVESAKMRCAKMVDNYITPFLKYIQ